MHTHTLSHIVNLVALPAPVAQSYIWQN